MTNFTHTHGITDTAYRALMADQGKPVGPWMVSERDNLSYLHSVAKLTDSEFDADYVHEGAVSRAKESAMLQCPIFEEEIFHVLLLSVPADYDGINDDCSCENMAGSADCIPESDLKQFIVGVRSFQLSKYFHPFILSGVSENSYFSRSTYPEALMIVVNAIKGAEWDYDMLEDNTHEITE